MAKLDKKIQEHRLAGARWILDIAQRDGIEAAEQELKLRGAVHIQWRSRRVRLKMSHGHCQGSICGLEVDK